MGQGIPAKFSWKHINKIKIKNNLPCKQRSKFIKNKPLKSFDRELSGKHMYTVFFYEQNKFWYNLNALLGLVRKKRHPEALDTIIKGFFGTSLTDITN